MKYKLDVMDYTRSAYGKTLLELGRVNKDIVVLDSDLSESTKTVLFGREYPERFFNVGCAEQNLMGMSAGLALAGKTVFASGFAMFGCGRGWEQIRNSIAYDSLNVKIVLTHAGITVGEDGSSHQILEDISLMRSIPGMNVVVPADAREVEADIRNDAEYNGPQYIRLSRAKTPIIFEDYDHDPTKPITLLDGADVTLMACGVMVSESIRAAYELEKAGVSTRVVNMNNIKPIDVDTVVKAAKETGAIVTCEEHSIFGGLGGVISEVLCGTYPVPQERVGTKDRFGKSGKAKELMEEFELTSKTIVSSAKKAIDRK